MGSLEMDWRVEIQVGRRCTTERNSCRNRSISCHKREPQPCNDQENQEVPECGVNDWTTSGRATAVQVLELPRPRSIILPDVLLGGHCTPPNQYFVSKRSSLKWQRKHPTQDELEICLIDVGPQIQS